MTFQKWQTETNGLITLNCRDWLFSKMLPLLPQIDPEKLYEATAVEPDKAKYLAQLCYSKSSQLLAQEVEEIINQKQK